MLPSTSQSVETTRHWPKLHCSELSDVAGLEMKTLRSWKPGHLGRIGDRGRFPRLIPATRQRLDTRRQRWVILFHRFSLASGLLLGVVVLRLFAAIGGHHPQSVCSGGPALTDHYQTITRLCALVNGWSRSPGLAERLQLFFGDRQGGRAISSQRLSVFPEASAGLSRKSTTRQPAADGYRVGVRRQGQGLIGAVMWRIFVVGRRRLLDYWQFLAAGRHELIVHGRR